jgi:outer membrane murein-binding lipoprotein Lpp
MNKRENELVVDAIVMAGVKSDMRIDQLTRLVEELQNRIEVLELSIIK